MTNRQLECFISLAGTLNFSLTAKEMYLTQPAVSQQIQALENDIGVKLFFRNRNRVSLSPAGIALLSEASDYLSYSRAVIQRVRQNSQSFSSHLNVSYSVCLRLMPLILQHYHSKRPNSLINFSFSTNLNLTQQLFNGHFDISAIFGDLTQDYGDCTFTELYSGGFVCVVAENHTLAKKSHVRCEDLSGEVLFALNDMLSNSAIRRLNSHLLERREIHEIHTTDNLGEAAILAEAGFGVAVLPHVFYEPHPGSIHIPFDYFEKYHIGLLSHASANADAEAFCQIALELCSADSGSPLIS